MSELPALLAAKLSGKVVHRAVPAATTGFSTMGATRVLLFTDGPGVYVHETGGMFGSAGIVGLDGDGLAAPGRLRVAWVDGALCGVVTLDAGRSATFVLEDEAAAVVAREWLARMPTPPVPSAFAQAWPIGVRLRFSATPEVLRDALLAGPPAVAAVTRGSLGRLEARPPRQVAPLLLGRTRELPPQAGALIEALAAGEAWVRVHLAAGRLLLSRTDLGDVASVPCGQLAWRDGALEGAVIVAGHEVERLEPVFADPDAAAAFRAAFDAETAGQEGPRGHTDLARVEGLDQDAVDLVLTDETLELSDVSGRGLLHAFRLGDPDTAIQGTGSEFLVVDAAVGPLRIRPSSQRFRERLLAHRSTARAAERSARQGPFLGLGADGAPVVWTVDAEGLSCRTSAGTVSHPVRALAPVAREVVDGSPWLVAGPVRLAAADPVLEGAANAITTAAAPTADLAGLLAEIGRLEEDWVLHAVLGPLAEVHATLRETLPDDGVRLRPPDDDDERVRLLAGLSEATGWVRRHLEEVRHRLPSFVAARDREWCASAGLEAPPAPSDGWRVALAPLAEVGRQVDRIEREIGQLDWLRRALSATAPSYGSLVMGLGLSVINPLRLLGTGAEAVRLASVKKAMASSDAAAAEQAARRVTEEWNHLVGVLVPVTVDSLREALPALRGPVAARLAEADSAEARKAAVARYARLHHFRTFPPRPEAPPRAEAIGLLRALTDSAPPPALVVF